MQSGTLKWNVAKRFSEFEKFHKLLLGKFPAFFQSTGLDIPRKAKLASALESEIVESRKLGFGAYLKRILDSTEIAVSIEVMTFLGLVRNHEDASESE